MVTSAAGYKLFSGSVRCRGKGFTHYLVSLNIPYVTMTLPGLSAGAVSASPDLSEVPAAGSLVLLVVPGVISVLSVPTSLTQN